MNKTASIKFILITLIVLIAFLLILVIQNKITGSSIQKADKIKLIKDCGEETIIYDFGNQCWQKSIKPESAKNWSDADDYCKSLTLANYTDWRLPTLDELWSIKRYMKTNSELFKDARFWTSTELKDNAYWYIDFRTNYKGFTSSSREGYGTKCIRNNFY